MSEFSQVIAADFQVACCTDFEEACCFVDSHTTPQTAGQYLIAQTRAGAFGVYLLPPTATP